jgi:hypothetical protein
MTTLIRKYLNLPFAKKTKHKYHLRRINSLLLKRYAIDEVVSPIRVGFFLLFSVLSLMLFAIIWLRLSNESFLPDSLMALCDSDAKFIYTVFGLFTLWIVKWLLLGKIIPKFIWIGILGWILMTGEIIPGMLKHNPDQINNEIGQVADDSVENISLNLEAKGYLLFDEKGFDIFFQKLSTLKNQPTLLIVLSIFLLLIWLFRWNIMFLFNLLLIVLGLHYHILIFIIGASIFLANVSILYREIKQRGQNHYIWNRVNMFNFITTMFTISTGEIIILMFMPLYIASTDNAGCISLVDLYSIFGMLFVGALVAVFFALITQAIWSGARLTDRT